MKGYLRIWEFENLRIENTLNIDMYFYNYKSFYSSFRGSNKNKSTFFQLPLRYIFLVFLAFLFSFNAALAVKPPDGGMYPITMLDKIPLKKAGLRISNNDIFNPNGTGILQAIVQI